MRREGSKFVFVSPNNESKENVSDNCEQHRDLIYMKSGMIHMLDPVKSLRFNELSII